MSVIALACCCCCCCCCLANGDKKRVEAGEGREERQETPAGSSNSSVYDGMSRTDSRRRPRQPVALCRSFLKRQLTDNLCLSSASQMLSTCARVWLCLRRAREKGRESENSGVSLSLACTDTQGARQTLSRILIHFVSDCVSSRRKRPSSFSAPEMHAA